MPSIKELEAFVATAEAGSFEAAARRLNATAPAIAKRIGELESDLGVRLFARSTRHCQITLRGRALIPFAQRVLGEIGEIQRVVADRSSLAGHIRFGVPETVAFTQVGQILRRASNDLPKIVIDIEIGVSTDLIRRVAVRELDIACVVGPVLEPNLVSEPFWDVPLAWVGRGPPDSEKPLTIEELAERTLLLPAGGRHIPTIEGWFKSRRLRPKHVIVCNSLSTALKMAAIGLGISLMPIECARHELDAGVITAVPVRIKLPTNMFVMTYPSGRLEPALDAFTGILRELSATLKAGGAKPSG
jgi:DNA-binding transcriptional LysR family regulator